MKMSSIITIFLMMLMNTATATTKDMVWFYAEFSRLQNDITKSNHLSETERKFSDNVFNQIQELFAELEHYNDLIDINNLYESSKCGEDSISSFIKNKKNLTTERLIRLIEFDRRQTLEQMTNSYNNFNSIIGNTYINALNDLSNYLKKKSD